jgi:oligopeptidase B
VTNTTLLGWLVLLGCALLPAAEDAAPKPPVARRVPHVVKLHGDVRADDYFWLRDKKKPEVLDHLKAENAYTAARTAHLKEFQEKLYQEALARLQQTDQDVPVPENGYLYYRRTVKGQQYPIHCRKKGSADAAEEVLLDGNVLGKGQHFFNVSRLSVSDDGDRLAYASDVTGFREYYLSVKDLRTGKLLEDRRRKVNTFSWAADGRTLFYVTEDAAKRPYRLYRHVAGGDKDELLYEEKDELYRLFVRRSRDRQYLFAESASSLTTEVRYLPAARPGDAFRVALPRRDGHEYHLDHRDGKFWIRTNRDAKTFRVVTAPVGKPDDWSEELPWRKGVTVENVSLFRDFVVFSEREDGLQQLAVRDLKTGQTHRVSWPEPVYSVFATPTPEFDTTALRFRYTSLVTPASVFEYDMKTRRRALLKQDKVLGGYDATKYASERIFATAKDGTKVPISLVYRKGTPRDGTAPLWLSGYGSYGASVPAAFAANNLLLLDRGVVWAWAHVRGGGDLGKTWHDDGKMLKKINTFTDFIACADHLVAARYTARDRLAIEGTSAGGLLIGATLNLRPDLCKVAVLNVPFVDVINSMLDASLPLTVQEYLEWGNPNQKGEYEYMKRYCPYSNLKPAEYPAMLVTTSLNDSQVMYWEPAKYVARLRTLKKGTAPLLLRCNMDGGHGGSSGRYDAIKERMFKVAFVLEQLGVKGP